MRKWAAISGILGAVWMLALLWARSDRSALPLTPPSPAVDRGSRLLAIDLCGNRTRSSVLISRKFPEAELFPVDEHSEFFPMSS
jgi:hypothetical protein